MVRSIPAGTRIMVHFHSGRDVEGIVEQWGEDAVLQNVEATGSIYIVSIEDAVESVETLYVPVAPPQTAFPSRQAIDRTADAFSQQYSQNRYASPFLQGQR